MDLYIKLFYEFFKVGLFSVGGGMATIPFLRDISLKTGWYSFGELADMIAVAESTPGPLGVNTATYVGFKTGSAQFGIAGGILGGVIATLGLILPSLAVIIIIAYFLEKFRKSKVVDAAFYGLRPASMGLIATAGITIMLLAFFGVGSITELFDHSQGIRFNPANIILFLLVLYCITWNKKLKSYHPIVFIAASAIVGIVFGM